MSHTLHREGTVESLSRDFNVMMHPAQNYNAKGAGVKARRIFELVEKYKIDNAGGSGCRNYVLCSGNFEEMRNSLPENDAVCSALFNDIEQATEFLQDLKDEDLGISVIVTGLYDMVVECCEKVGLKPHSVNMSLGIFGNKEKIAGDRIREIITMCGHGYLSEGLILDIIDQIKKKRITVEKATKELNKLCKCGIYNTERSVTLLKALAEE
jgi:hypothetical protein